MKLMFKILLFMIMFNMAAITIAATTIFPPGVTMYGDAFDISEGELPSAEQMFSRLIIRDDDSSSDILGFNLVSFAAIISFFVGVIVVQAFTKTPATALAAGMVVTMFIVMFNNSRTIFDSLMTNLDSVVLYIALMLGVGFLFIVILTAMDQWTGQNNSD